MTVQNLKNYTIVSQILKYCHSSSLIGTCQQEEPRYEDIFYKWPQASAGTIVNITCPNNPAFSVSRECSAEGVWQEFDKGECGLLAGKLEMINEVIVSANVRLNSITLLEYLY